ncbi:hypothetical protein D039_0760B, partial [Vibrio parahaemolyticus EKP-028]
AAPVNVHAEN